MNLSTVSQAILSVSQEIQAEGEIALGISGWQAVLLFLAGFILLWLFLLVNMHQSEVEVRKFEAEIGAHAGSHIVEDMPEIEVELPVPSRTGAPAVDDLTRIEGIGPKVSALLNEAGIFSFAELAQANSEHLRDLLDQADLRMIDPSSWTRQAQLAAHGAWADLDALQADLKGGRALE